jgi:hypothetical protein
MKITKTQLQQVIREAIQEEMSSFDMAEDVIELLGSKYNIMEDDVPTILFAMAQSLEDKPKSPAASAADMERYESDYRDPPREPLKGKSGRPLSGAEMDRLARDI